MFKSSEVFGVQFNSFLNYWVGMSIDRIGLFIQTVTEGIFKLLDVPDLRHQQFVCLRQSYFLVLLFFHLELVLHLTFRQRLYLLLEQQLQLSQQNVLLKLLILILPIQLLPNLSQQPLQILVRLLLLMFC